MPSSPFIDGNSNLKYRLIKNTGDTDPTAHIPYVTPDPDFVQNSSVVVVPRVTNVDTTIVSGAILSGIAFIAIDCRYHKSIMLRVNNLSTTAAFTGFRLFIGSFLGGGFYEQLTPDDNYPWTTGTGEAEGNVMKQIRKVGTQNPRFVPANGSCWMILNVADVAEIAFNILVANGTNVRLLYTMFG
jgi:hypothetical protein